MVPNFHSTKFCNKRSITKLFTTNIWVSCSLVLPRVRLVIDAMTQLNFSTILSSILRHLCCHHKLMACCYTKTGHVHFFFHIGKRVFHLVLEITTLVYMHGTYSLTHEWNCNSPGLSIVCSLPQRYKVAVHRCPLMFHENYSVSYYEIFSYEILV